MLDNTMDITTVSSNPQIDATKLKIQNCVEVFFGQICGDSETLRPVMLNTLLVLVTESDWALPTVVDVDYIEPIEQFCKKTKPSAVPISLPKLLIMIVPSDSTDSSSELVPFAARLCGRLTEHVSEMESRFAESSPSDRTISAPSASLPNESPPFARNTVLEVICEGFSLFSTLLLSKDDSFDNILIDCDFVPLLKSTVIACLDLLEQLKTNSTCPPAGQTDVLMTVLNRSWDLTAECLTQSHKSLHPIVESAFFDIPQLCSLVERTCCHSSPSHSCHLRMIINLDVHLPHLIPRLLEENLVERVIDTSKPMAVPTTHGEFHKDLVWAISNMIWDPTCFPKDKGEQKRIRNLQFERALKPAKQYLQFILQREEFITKDGKVDEDLPTRIANLLAKTLVLERVLFEYGEIVETGREEWEVGVDNDDVKFAVLAECKSVPKLTTTDDIGAPTSCVALVELLELLVFCDGIRDPVDVVNGRDLILTVRFGDVPSDIIAAAGVGAAAVTCGFHGISFTPFISFVSAPDHTGGSAFPEWIVPNESATGVPGLATADLFLDDMFPVAFVCFGVKMECSRSSFDRSCVIV
ncbi:hypothetical protein BLNAU_9807 [Blattamonas nauphoetae]|uniref:Uncharacterized protein n=1 Tax=Blattamonas nauphoetae TaxID=2049346 RepID=A0ABQ9XUV3_9EUKA|nr:hypothetical protein BLNAU_9807 [Blattamonas nauphoetae]